MQVPVFILESACRYRVPHTATCTLTIRHDGGMLQCLDKLTFREYQYHSTRPDIHLRHPADRLHRTGIGVDTLQNTILST